MKILMLCYEYPHMGGGGAKVVDGLSKELVRKGHEVDLVTMGYKGLLNYEQKGNLNIYRTIWKRRDPNTCTALEMIPYLITAFPLILKLCRRNKYNVNNTHFIFPDGVLAWLIKIATNLSYVITAHGSDVPGYNPDRFKTLHSICSPIWKIIMRRASEVIFPSQHLKAIASQIIPGISGTIIPNGLDPNKFSSDKPKLKRILLVTRMFKRKSVQFFLQAFEGIEQDIEVNIVGDGPYLKSLRELAMKLRLNVNFMGFIDNQSKELKNLFERSSIFVFTSESENFPIVLLEAMAAGLAIITTNDTGCVEVVGDTGLLVNPKDVKDLQKALLKYIQHPELCSQLGERTRKRFDDNFTWEIVTNRYVDVYEKIWKTN